jgi:hypothetical protein
MPIQAPYDKLFAVWVKNGKPRTFEYNHASFMYEDAGPSGIQFKPIGENALPSQREILNQFDIDHQQNHVSEPPPVESEESVDDEPVSNEVPEVSATGHPTGKGRRSKKSE